MKKQLEKIISRGVGGALGLGGGVIGADMEIKDSEGGDKKMVITMAMSTKVTMVVTLTMKIPGVLKTERHGLYKLGSQRIQTSPHPDPKERMAHWEKDNYIQDLYESIILIDNSSRLFSLTPEDSPRCGDICTRSGTPERVE